MLFLQSAPSQPAAHSHFPALQVPFPHSLPAHRSVVFVVDVAVSVVPVVDVSDVTVVDVWDVTVVVVFALVVVLTVTVVVLVEHIVCKVSLSVL